jgi:hypothetical protein
LRGWRGCGGGFHFGQSAGGSLNLIFSGHGTAEGDFVLADRPVPPDELMERCSCGRAGDNGKTRHLRVVIDSCYSGLTLCRMLLRAHHWRRLVVRDGFAASLPTEEAFELRRVGHSVLTHTMIRPGAFLTRKLFQEGSDAFLRFGDPRAERREQGDDVLPHQRRATLLEVVNGHAITLQGSRPAKVEILDLREDSLEELVDAVNSLHGQREGVPDGPGAPNYYLRRDRSRRAAVISKRGPSTMDAVSELAEHDERHVRRYVQLETGEPVTLVQQVDTRRVLGGTHDLYDVHCETSRWWVITNATCLYSQERFPEIEMAFTYHIGLWVLMSDRQRTEKVEEEREPIRVAWRRYAQAVDAMDAARESQDFQAIGVRCREALLALVSQHVDAAWLGEVAKRPQAGNFKGWAELFATRLATDRLRSYTKTLSSDAWDLAVWLQHKDGSTEWDAEIVITTTGQLLNLMGLLIRRHEAGPPEQCGRCGSYRITSDGEPYRDESGEPLGWRAWLVCGACGWRSEPVETIGWGGNEDEHGDED